MGSGDQTRVLVLCGSHFLDGPLLPVLLWLSEVETGGLQVCVLSLTPDESAAPASFGGFSEDAAV